MLEFVFVYLKKFLLTLKWKYLFYEIISYRRYAFTASNTHLGFSTLQLMYSVENHFWKMNQKRGHVYERWVSCHIGKLENLAVVLSFFFKNVIHFK